MKKTKAAVKQWRPRRHYIKEGDNIKGKLIAGGSSQKEGAGYKASTFYQIMLCHKIKYMTDGYTADSKSHPVRFF